MFPTTLIVNKLIYRMLAHMHIQYMTLYMYMYMTLYVYMYM